MKTVASVAFFLLLGAFSFAGISEVMAASEITPSEAELCLIDFQKVPRLAIDDLKSRLDDPSVVIIDMRAAADWNGSSTKIKGALREVYADTEAWASRYDKAKTLVLYCA